MCEPLDPVIYMNLTCVFFLKIQAVDGETKRQRQRSHIRQRELIEAKSGKEKQGREEIHHSHTAV